MTKKCIAIFLSVLLLSSAVFSLGCSPDEPQVIETEQFLPEPDEVVGYYAKKEFSFSSEQKQTVYNAFMALMPTLTACEQIDAIGVAQDDYRNRYVGMELSYHQTYRYTGDLGKITQRSERIHFRSW